MKRGLRFPPNPSEQRYASRRVLVIGVGGVSPESSCENSYAYTLSSYRNCTLEFLTARVLKWSCVSNMASVTSSNDQRYVRAKHKGNL